MSTNLSVDVYESKNDVACEAETRKEARRNEITWNEARKNGVTGLLKKEVGKEGEMPVEMRLREMRKQE